MNDDALHLIEQFQLAPHPEGGHYRRIYEAAHAQGERPALTAIRFLLAAGEASRWHRVDGEEAWHWQRGGTLELLTYDAASSELRRELLGPDGPGIAPMRVVPSGVWQAARPLERFTLVACTVSPGFAWSGFELMDAGDPAVPALVAAGAWPVA